MTFKKSLLVLLFFVSHPAHSSPMSVNMLIENSPEAKTPGLKTNVHWLFSSFVGLNFAFSGFREEDYVANISNQTIHYQFPAYSTSLGLSFNSRNFLANRIFDHRLIASVQTNLYQLVDNNNQSLVDPFQVSPVFTYQNLWVMTANWRTVMEASYSWQHPLYSNQLTYGLGIEYLFYIK